MKKVDRANYVVYKTEAYEDSPQLCCLPSGCLEVTDCQCDGTESLDTAQRYLLLTWLALLEALRDL